MIRNQIETEEQIYICKRKKKRYKIRDYLLNLTKYLVLYFPSNYKLHRKADNDLDNVKYSLSFKELP